MLRIPQWGAGGQFYPYYPLGPLVAVFIWGDETQREAVDRCFLAIDLIGQDSFGFNQVRQRMGGEIAVGAMEDGGVRVGPWFCSFQ